MGFLKTLWTDRSAPKITAAQLNRIEQGIADAHAGSIAPPILNALPPAPADGQVIRLVVDEAGVYGGPVVWACQYRGFKADGVTPNPNANRWEVLSPQPLRMDGGSVAATAPYNGLMSNGHPVIALPFAGDWDIEYQANILYNNSAAINQMEHYLLRTGDVRVDPGQAPTVIGNFGGAGAPAHNRVVVKGLATATSVYSRSVSTSNQPYIVYGPWMLATPLRIG